MPVLLPILWIACCCLLPATLNAQAPAFYHLSTAEGLSDNNVTTARPDKNGILWIGTTEGLNSFDGNTVTTYYKYHHPELPDNNIRAIEVDQHNNIWIQTVSSRLVMLDGRRKFHAITVGDGNDDAPVNAIITSARYGMIALKGNRHYVVQTGKSPRAMRLHFPTENIIPAAPQFFGKIDDDKVFFYGNGKLVVVDYSIPAASLVMELKGLSGGAAINAQELLMYPVNGEVFYRISIPQQRVIKEYRQLRTQEGQPIAGDLRQMAAIGKERFAITTRFSGIYLLDVAQQSLQHWLHDPLDQRSVGGNNTFRIHYDTSGYLFITTQTSGLHYFNLNTRTANTRSYFRDGKGEVFDGYIEAITTAADGSIIMGAQDRLIRWHRPTNTTSFINLRLPDGTALHGRETIRTVEVDARGHLWVGTSRYGILILNNAYNTIAQIRQDTTASASLPSNWINGITTDSIGNKWIATFRGIGVLEQPGNRIADLSKHPQLARISRLHSYGIWFDRQQRMWVGTTSGAWCFDAKQKSLSHYSTATGLPHNAIYSFCQDNNGTIYLGTPAGLALLHEDGALMATYNRSNGLRNDKCEDMLKDNDGFIWIGNLSSILRYDPQHKKFAVFEDGHGINQPGFRIRSSFKSAEGELFWGTDKGLTSFYPQQISEQAARPRPVITAVALRDTTYHFTAADQLVLPHNVTDISFQFSSGELAGAHKTMLQYRLLGLDDEWKTPLVNGQAAYNQLPPGNYTFELQASHDGVHWTPARYPLQLQIDKPWWQETWFRLLMLLFVATIVWVLFRVYQHRRRSTAVQKMIEYFAHSGFEHSSVDDILWDIARNCISRLDFEDCVIYLVDEQKNVLVQKAAYGPKSPKAYEIANPIEIPVGSGIVGTVASTGQPIIIKDTTKDERYIVDDELRYSEISVPIIHEGKVIGVIDSENKRKNFYTQQQLRALQTIASLCSAKISRAMAMEAMKKSKAALQELNVKMAESRFLNLRLQMNPHFLFNSLSSIQHLIVSQQTTRAYKYLTTFSNFLRLLLHHAEDNFIPLEQEVKILNMYIELESLRFDQSFQYSITVDENLLNDEVLLPSLMVQPFAENAIWHGLLHKEGDKQLLIDFRNQEDEFICCTISDNGIGRKSAAIINSNKISSRIHESKGIGIIRQRLQLLEQKTGKPATIHIEDLEDAGGQPLGTRVTITVPFYNEDA